VQPSAIPAIGYISMLWVDEAFRRKGAARLLVQAVEARFARQGLQHVDLHYLVLNEEVGETWLRLGYKPHRVTARKSLGDSPARG
jgi:ribosomal protein S18 acetylase RimI-like enzyme